MQRPETLQIRVQRRYPGRVRAGAPEPTRSLGGEELLANLRHFTAGKRGPRSAPCTALVLSGVGLLGDPALPGAIAAARDLGIRRTIVHAGIEDLSDFDPRPWCGLVDQLVLPLQPPGAVALAQAARALALAREAGIGVAVNTVLTTEAVAGLPSLVAALRSLGPQVPTLAFPFPGACEPALLPRPAALLPALEGAVAALREAGAHPRLKGLPACWLGPLAALLAPSSNRWYVDADHQLERALLFFPDVVAFHKGENCRFCAQDGACDGFFAEWLCLPGFPPLDPISAR